MSAVVAHSQIAPLTIKLTPYASSCLTVSRAQRIGHHCF